jgi:hypothetical protein
VGASDSPYATTEASSTDSGAAPVTDSPPPASSETRAGAADGGAGGGEAFDNPGSRTAATDATQDVTDGSRPDSPRDASPAPDGGAGGGEAFDNPGQVPNGQTDPPHQPHGQEISPDDQQPPDDQPTDDQPTDDLSHGDLKDKTRADVGALADRMGLQPFGQMDEQGQPRKWKDPDSGQERLRIDQGHIDKTTHQPYNDPKAAVPHVHGYDQNGEKIVDPADGNPHFPLR